MGSPRGAESPAHEGAGTYFLIYLVTNGLSALRKTFPLSFLPSLSLANFLPLGAAELSRSPSRRQGHISPINFRRSPASLPGL